MAFPTFKANDADGVPQTRNTLPDPGRQAAANSLPTVLSTEDLAAINAIVAKLLAAPATEAKQDTGNTSLATIAGAVSGGHMQSDIVALPSPAATIYHGQKTVAVAGTEEALAASQALTSGVRIKALHGNTGYVYVGKNPVTSTTGYVLDAGEEVFVEVANLNTVYIDVSVSGEGVSYLGS